MRARGLRVVSACILLMGCSEATSNGGDGGGADGATRDAGVPFDNGGGADAGSGDAGMDGGASDAGVDASASDAGIDDAGAGDAAMDADGGADASSDAGPTLDGGSASCPAFQSPPLEWPLPSASTMARFPDVTTLDCPSSSAPRFTLLDLDGDDLDDLVLTSACGGAGELGQSRWDVYLNTGSGFASAPIHWTLPTAGYPDGFHHVESTTCADSLRYRTFDIDGDRRPDLVVTSACTGTSSVGDTHWVVHLNDGSGFATSGTSFALPTGYTGGFPDVAASTCTFDAPRYALLDVDGDLDPDLVVTSLCDGSAMVGHTRWLVHENDGSRFAMAATDFALPSGYRAASFTRLAGETCPFGDSPRFGTTDLDGDRVPDLVVTSLCSGGPIGRMRWAVHLGGAGGFDDSATAWSLPSYAPGAFLTPEGPASCTPAAQPRYVLRDADGDGMLDLIVTGLCSGAGPLGRSEWAVHVNTGTGFGAALSWALPPDYPGTDLGDVHTVSCATTGGPRYDVRDLDGDGIMDLVATSRCSGAGPLGADYWYLHRGCIADAPL